MLQDSQSPGTLAFWWKWAMIGVSGIGGLWIRAPYSIRLLLAVMGLDIISGFFASAANNNLRADSFGRGIVKKLAVFPLLALLHLTEKPLNLPFEFESIAAVCFVVYEAMSIVENCARAGVPIPVVIVTFLAKAKVKTATPEQIKEEFAIGDSTKVSVEEKVGIVKTLDAMPDLKVETKTTVLEEKHVEQIPPSSA